MAKDSSKKYLVSLSATYISVNLNFDKKRQILAKILGNFSEMNLKEGYFKGISI